MRLLLDTHIWLWSLLEPSRLGPRTAAALEDPDNELWLSPISVWETLMLAERQRVELRPDPEQWIRTCLRRDCRSTKRSSTSRWHWRVAR